VGAELERWVKAGFIRPIDEDERRSAPCVSPAFVSWVRPDKPRLVVDLRQVNAHLADIKFKIRGALGVYGGAGAVQQPDIVGH